MRRIVLIPLSGYTNRLQAIASAAILADQLGAVLEVCWEPDAVAPVPMDRVLSADFCREHEVTPAQVVAHAGVAPGEVPLYLNRHGSTVTLAGHLRGEQAFMADLDVMLSDPASDSLENLVIKAGGKFYLPRAGATEDAFRRLRRDFYRARFLRADIEDAAREQAAAHAPFVGLHLRYTDRAHQAPFARTIDTALRAAASESGLASVFVAGDSARARTEWTKRVRSLGLEPWSVAQDSWDRSQAGSEFPALVDWRALSLAERSVYFAESSFAVEAAVASDGYERSTPLAASPVRGTGIRLASLGRSAVTYPRRHGWWGAT